MNMQGNPIRSKLKMFREGSRTDKCDQNNSTFSSSMVQNGSRVGGKAQLRRMLREKENAVRDETALLYKRQLEYQDKLHKMQTSMQNEIDELHARLVGQTKRNRALQAEYNQLMERPQQTSSQHRPKNFYSRAQYSEDSDLFHLNRRF